MFARLHSKDKFEERVLVFHYAVKLFIVTGGTIEASGNDATTGRCLLSCFCPSNAGHHLIMNIEEVRDYCLLKPECRRNTAFWTRHFGI